VSPVRVLFLCSGNSARSIIGAALLRDLGGSDFAVYSAGTHPKGINPLTARVLAREHIDISGDRSKHVSEFDGQSFDYAITVCDDAAEECPLFPGAPERIHWSLADPAAVHGTEDEKLNAFRRTVRDLRTHLNVFIYDARKAIASRASIEARGGLR